MRVTGVEPKKPRNTMLAHLIDDYDPEEHRRAGEKELFARSYVAALPESD